MKSKSIAQSFFGEKERAAIREAVHKAELKTSGEVVPMVVGESHPYPLAVVRGATLVALCASLIVTPWLAEMFWLGPSNLWIFLGVFAPIYIIVHLCLSVCHWCRRLFLFDDEMDREVRNSAFSAFFTEELYKTKKSNGILIYISLLERRAWILADSGINERIPQKKWDEAVVLLTQGIREKNQCKALCDVIAMVGGILAEEFPIQDGDINELHDLIIH